MKIALSALALAAALGGGFVAGRSLGDSGTRLARIERAPVGGLATPSAFAPPALAERPVKNVVLLIGDGMGLAQIAAARLRAYGPDGRFVMDRLPVSGSSRPTPPRRS